MGWLFYDALGRPLPGLADGVGKRLQSRAKEVLKEVAAARSASRAKMSDAMKRTDSSLSPAEVETLAADGKARVDVILARPYTGADGFGPAAAAEDVDREFEDAGRDSGSEAASVEADCIASDEEMNDSERLELKEDLKRRRRVSRARQEEADHRLSVILDDVHDGMDESWDAGWDAPGWDHGYQRGRIDGWFGRKYRFSDPGKPYLDGYASA